MYIPHRAVPKVVLMGPEHIVEQVELVSNPGLQLLDSEAL